MIEINYNFFDTCTSLSDAARKLFGKDDFRSCEKIKELTKECNFNWEIWNERRKPKIIETQCLTCGKIIKQIDNKSAKKFCNSSCAASYNNKKRHRNDKPEKICVNCGKPISHRNKYCSKECEVEYKDKIFIEQWQRGEENGVSGLYGISQRIRNFLLKKHNNKCEKCGWGEINPHTNKTPLQIHHIDGDCTNNKEDNLQLLCPNCHSLTDTFGNLNKNSKRIYRKQKGNIQQIFNG